MTPKLFLTSTPLVVSCDFLCFKIFLLSVFDDSYSFEVRPQSHLDFSTLKAKDLEHLFFYLWDVFSSFENHLFNSFAHLFIRKFVLDHV
jgi:hypothetical protein